MLSLNGKTVGPFTHPGEVDVDSVAAYLGCEPREVLKVSMRIDKFSAAERKAQAGEAPGESLLTWRDLRKLNPAQDLLDSKNPGAEFCVLLPLSCMVPSKKDETKLEEKILPHVVLSSKQAYVATPAWFQSRGISHTSKIELPPPRWSTDSSRGWRYFNLHADKLETYRRIKERFEFYLDCVEAGMYWYIPLWILGTYFFSLFGTFPIVGLTGTQRSGKSKALRFVQLLAFNGKWSVNMSVSRMFRAAESLRCAIALDEAEGMADPERRQAIRSLLNSSYENGATADLTNKTTGEGEEFSVYGPRMLGAIGGFENVLESRAIVFVMLRTASPKGDREIELKDPEWQEIRDQLYLLMMNHWAEVKAIYDRMTSSPEIHGRDWQLWRPLFALAEWIGDPQLKAQIYTLAQRKTAYRKEKDQFEADEILLLKVLRENVFEDRWIPLAQLKQLMEEEYGEDNAPRPLDNRYAAKLMDRMNWHERRKKGKAWEYMVKVNEIHDRCERYGVLEDEAPPEQARL